MRKLKNTMICVAVLVATAGQLEAGLMFYDNEADFIAAAGTLANYDSFESPLASNSPYASLDRPGTPGLTIYETKNGVFNYIYLSRRVGATDGSQSAWFSSHGRSILNLVFDSPINAIGGFALTNSSSSLTVDWGGDITGPSFEISSAAPTFWGVIDTMNTFQTLTFEVDGGNYPSIGIDELRWGTASTVVPEPTSIALFGLGSLGIGVIARRRQRKQTEKANSRD